MSEPERHSGESITIMRVDPIYDTGVLVTCPVQEADGRLPDRYSAYHDNISPPLRWSNVPDVKAWAIVVEDPDAPRDEPFVHWMLWNIRGEVTQIPEGLGNEPKLVSPQGAIQGKNDMGGYGWFGPRPPAGHGVHRYYFQVFALNDWIEMGPDTPLKELLNALKSRTLAKGEMMATYERPASNSHAARHTLDGPGVTRALCQVNGDKPMVRGGPAWTALRFWAVSTAKLWGRSPPPCRG